MILRFILTWYVVFIFTSQVSGYHDSADYRKPIYNGNTPYRFVQNLLQDRRVNTGSTVFYRGQTCHIVNLNLLLRHGSRSPVLFEIKRINALNAKLKNIPKVTNKFPFIKRWKNPFPENQPYTQLMEGDREQALLGKRFGMMFQNIFKYNLNNIKYRISNTTVANRSYEAFTDSLNTYFRSDIPAPPAITDNQKLYFFDPCKNFEELNTMALYQYNLFLGGPEMKNVVEKMRSKLGTTNITTEEVLTIQVICYFEVGVFDNIQWCRLFDIEDLLVIDYLIDLRRYWRRSYGMRLNAQISCQYTRNMFETFDACVYGRKSRRRYNVAEVSFAHGFTLFPIYTAFGLFQDVSPLLASNYETHKRRVFRADKMAPMSGNMAVALYKCGNYDEDYVVKMFVNEEAVIIPKCDSYICPYCFFRLLYKSLAGCDLQGLCENKKN